MVGEKRVVSGETWLGIPILDSDSWDYRNPELKNPKIYGGDRFRQRKKKKKKAGTFFSDRNRKRNRKNRLKKTTGIRNSAEFRRNSGGIPNQVVKQRLKMGS